MRCCLKTDRVTGSRDANLPKARKFRTRVGLPSFLLFSWNSNLQDSCDDSTVAKVTLGLWYCWGLVPSNRLVGRSRMAIQLTPTRIKGSKYLLIPKNLAQLLEIDDESILNLTIEDTEKGQRLVYSIREKSSNSTEN